ncbi:hypothetical protein B0H14DRAFT_2594033 [Mycena olivaceomarginata]|nr:hypothetical protein B0H14DRAFT_2594033 [Mycena olivaceomarginata]
MNPIGFNGDCKICLLSEPHKKIVKTMIIMTNYDRSVLFARPATLVRGRRPILRRHSTLASTRNTSPSSFYHHGEQRDRKKELKRTFAPLEPQAAAQSRGGQPPVTQAQTIDNPPFIGMKIDTSLTEHIKCSYSLVMVDWTLGSSIPALETRSQNGFQVADRFSEDSPIGALAKFPQLETFVIYCQTISGFHDYELDRTYEFGDLPSLQVFGLAIMKACPTLRRADIGSHISPATDVWYAGSKKRELACTVTRSPDGDIKSVCATGFDFHAVGMFW